MVDRTARLVVRLPHRSSRAFGPDARAGDVREPQLQVVNLVDFLIIDVLVYDVLRPDFMLMPGADAWMREHVTMAFHLEAYAMGFPIMAAFALVASGLVVAFGRRSPSPAAV